MKALLLLFSLSTSVCFAQENDSSGTIKIEKPKIISEARFPGGNNALMYFVSHEMNYPKDARENGLSGICVVRFSIETDGTLSNVVVLKGVPGCTSCDIEVLRLIGTMPKWIPAQDSSGPVKTDYWLPFTFRLQ